MKPYINVLPKPLLNELRVLSVYASEPKLGYNEALNRSGLPESTFKEAHRRLVRRGCLYRVSKGVGRGHKSQYAVNYEKAFELLDRAWKLIWTALSKNPSGPITRLVEQYSIDLSKELGDYLKRRPEEMEIGEAVRSLFLPPEEAIKDGKIYHEVKFVDWIRRVLYISREASKVKHLVEPDIPENYLRLARRIEDRAWKTPSYRPLLEQPVNQCPKCRSTNLHFDDDTSEIVCRSCGLVICRPR